MKKFTKIICPPADSKFIVLFLRDRKISREKLNLRPSKGSTFKIWNHSIKASLLSFYEDFKQSRLDLSDFFQVNIIDAACRWSEEFNLRETVFDEAKKVCKNRKYEYVSSVQTEIIFCDERGQCFFETDLSFVKFNRDGESLPYKIPLSCLVSLLNLPPIAPSWTPELLDDYSENNQFGFNIYKLFGNKAELSIHFPGEN